jgi:hypothetical protein
VKLPAQRAGLPANVVMITRSALTPLRESVSALPAPAYRQEGGASSRLDRELETSYEALNSPPDGGSNFVAFLLGTKPVDNL